LIVCVKPNILVVLVRKTRGSSRVFYEQLVELFVVKFLD
jgi:hypothetical protein